MSLTQEQRVEMYRRVLRIRYFDDEAVLLMRNGDIPGAVHTSAGQEGEVVGACMALRKDDYMVGNHRSHGHPIGKGAGLNGLMAELMGKRTGVNRGKGGSMHLADFSVGSVGESSIVGSGLPIAVGAALGAGVLGTDRVCLCFFGDGASNQGTFHESINLAALWRLPAIFLCENNHYAVSTPVAKSVSAKTIADRAIAYNIPGVVVDGQDAEAVYAVVSEAVGRARDGQGPSLIEARTYRYHGHAAQLRHMPDDRPPEELAAWRARDPIVILRERLVHEGVLAERAVTDLEDSIRAEVNEAVEFAHSSPFPSLEEAFENLYSNPIQISR